MVQIPWPFTNAPGAEAQEGAGKLINVFIERRGDEQSIVWRRVPGCKTFVVDPSVGTIAGSATFLAVSSVVNAVGALAGTSAVAGVGTIMGALQTEGELNSSSTVAGVSAVKIAAASTMAGTATFAGFSE